MNAMDKTTERIANMTICILYDKFDFRERRIEKALLLTESLKKKYRNKELTAQHLISYALTKGVDVVEITKKIPTSYKAKLGEGGKFNGNGVAGVEAVILMELGLTVAVLKETPFRFTKKQMNEFVSWLLYYIDSYYKNYVNDRILKAQIYEDEKVKKLFVA